MNKKREQHDRSTHTPLSDAERNEMKAAFAAFLEMHPVREPERPRHPLGRFFKEHMLASKYAVVGLSVACMFTAGLSEFSLPDDSLYAVKTGINERILLGSAYVSPALHAHAEHTVFTRRLAEAEQLMLLDRFKDETADEVQRTIDDHTTALEASIARAETSGEADEANEVRDELTKTREQYDPLLDLIELRSNVEDTSVIDILLGEAVDEYGGSLVGGSADELAAIESAVMDGYADTMLKELTTLHRDIAAALDDDAYGTSSATGTVATFLEESNTLLDKAEAKIAVDAPEEALAYLQDASDKAHQALTAVKDAKKAHADDEHENSEVSSGETGDAVDEIAD